MLGFAGGGLNALMWVAFSVSLYTFFSFSFSSSETFEPGKRAQQYLVQAIGSINHPGLNTVKKNWN